MKNKKIFFPKLIITDFDGCLTDDRVWLNEHGEEFVAANRKDGLGIKRVKKLDSEVLSLLSLLDLQLNDKEKLYIKQYNTKFPHGYNLTEGGEGLKGFHFTNEHCNKISISKIGQKYPKEHGEKIRQSKLGKKRDQSIIDKIMNKYIRKIGYWTYSIIIFGLAVLLMYI